MSVSKESLDPEPEERERLAREDREQLARAEHENASHQLPCHPVWSAAAIGKVVGIDTRSAYHLLQNGLLPAQKIGKLWVSSREQLEAVITGKQEGA